jgi:hypothetical protein
MDVPEMTKKQKRALRLLIEEAAQETQDRPLDVLSDLSRLGMVQRRPYQHYFNGRLWDSYETTLTEYGAAVAAALKERS